MTPISVHVAEKILQKHVKADFDQRLECAAPKLLSKYTTERSESHLRFSFSFAKVFVTVSQLIDGFHFHFLLKSSHSDIVNLSFSLFKTRLGYIFEL